MFLLDIQILYDKSWIVSFNEKKLDLSHDMIIENNILQVEMD